MGETFMVNGVRFKVEVEKHRHACRCHRCGAASVETLAHRFLKKFARQNPRHPHTNAHHIAREIGVPYRTALVALMNHPGIKMECWHVNSAKYLCREFSLR